MSVNYKDKKYEGRFIYMPRVGEQIIVDIKEVREVKSENPRFNFSETVPVMAEGEPVIDDEGDPVTKKKDLGYHIEAELANGKILSVTSMSAFLSVFKKYEINDGERIKIFHKAKGEWEVEKLAVLPKEEKKNGKKPLPIGTDKRVQEVINLATECGLSYEDLDVLRDKKFGKTELKDLTMEQLSELDAAITENLV